MNSSIILARVKLIAALCSIALVIIGVSGCGGSDDGDSPPVVGAAGGTVAGPNGAQVVVPPGALAANTAIAVSQSSSGSPALPAGMNAFGSMYAFTPHGTSFAVPVTITVPFTAASLPAGATPVLYKTNAAGTWEPVASATVNAGMISAQVTSFSWLMIGNVPPQINTQPADTSVVQPTTASFSVAALGTPPLSYRWQRSDDAGMTFVDIAGATASSYTTGATTVAADNGDRYRVIVSNIEGAATSNVATLTVTATAPPAPAAGARIAGGNGWSLARRANGQMSSWGTDSAEALGDGINGDGSRNIPGPVAFVTDAVNIATGHGSLHGLSVRANGEVWGWGYNMFGQLGVLGNGFSTPVPMKDAGGNNVTNVRSAAAGTLHSLVLRTDGTVLATGMNMSGQLGDGTTTNRTHAALVAGLNNVTAIAAGGQFSLALRNDGTVWAWGANGQGQLGDGSFTSRSSPVQVSGLAGIIAIAAGNEFALALQANGDVWAWGRNDNSQLGDGSAVANRNVPGRVTITGVSTIAAGAQHGIAILAISGSVNAWGFNEFGQLGVGDGANRMVPTAVAGLPALVTITGGQNHTLAVDAAGNVWAWGSNSAGQLGLGSATASFNTPQQVPALNLN